MDHLAAYVFNSRPLLASKPSISYTFVVILQQAVR